MSRIDAEKNRLAILNAFDRLVSEADKPLTLTDVIKASGLGRATVYRHFPDIGSLAFERLNDGYRSLFNDLRGLYKDSTNNEVDAFTKDVKLELFKQKLGEYFVFCYNNKILLQTPECQKSEAYTNARVTLRSILKEILEVNFYDVIESYQFSGVAHLIACSVEAENWPKTYESTQKTVFSLIDKLLK